MERISTKRTRLWVGEKLALPNDRTPFVVPGEPEEMHYVYDASPLKKVGKEFYFDVAPQAITLVRNREQGEWQADPGRCVLIDSKPVGVVTFHGQTFVKLWRSGYRPQIKAEKRGGDVIVYLPRDYRHIEGWLEVGGEYDPSREDEYYRAWFSAETKKEQRKKSAPATKKKADSAKGKPKAKEPEKKKSLFGWFKK